MMCCCPKECYTAMMHECWMKVEHMKQVYPSTHPLPSEIVFINWVRTPKHEASHCFNY
uniref:Uncharacterized protein n=1 Tax=Rhizophora mucronata TaxID=61149 RepID=A0A2P2NGX2_RHIMU